MTVRHSALRIGQDALATPLPRVLRPQRAVPADAVRPTRAEINLANLRFNLHAVQKYAAGSEVWAVLKADGYGHGAKGVARTLERAGASGLCVALLEEGVELREAGLRIPILVMGGYYGRAWGELLRHDLTPVVFDPSQIEALGDEVHYSRSEPIRVHVKIDTGMGRLGAMPEAVRALGQALLDHPQVRLEGLMTHFACADTGSAQSIDEQLDRFDAATATLGAMGLRPSVRHAANSAGLLKSERARLDMVRPGIALFGVAPQRGLAPELRPVMRISSEIVALREVAPGMSVGYGATWQASRRSRIATIPVGYADGLSRGLSNRGSVLVRGKRAPIVGIVSMDMTMIDVTEIEGASLRDEVVILGGQKGPLGQDAIGAEQIAEELETIPWEILTSVSRRVPRFYREP